MYIITYIYIYTVYIYTHYTPYIYIYTVYIYMCVYVYIYTKFHMKNGMRITTYRFAIDLNGQCCKQDNTLDGW